MEQKVKDLEAQVTTLTSERDALAQQFDAFKEATKHESIVSDVIQKTGVEKVLVEEFSDAELQGFLQGYVHAKKQLEEATAAAKAADAGTVQQIIPKAGMNDEVDPTKPKPFQWESRFNYGRGD